MTNDGQTEGKSTIKDESLIVFSFGVLMTLLAGIYFQIQGYPLVNTATETLDVITPPLYMLPVFLPLGILVGEVFCLWRQNEPKSAIQLFVTISIMGSLSFFRLITTIPISGHAIILTFFLLHEIITNTHKHLLRIVVGIVIFVITCNYKFLVWSDPLTFLLGIIVGLILWVLSYLCGKILHRNAESFFDSLQFLI